MVVAKIGLRVNIRGCFEARVGCDYVKIFNFKIREAEL